MNGWQDQYLRSDGLVGDDLNPVLAAQLGVNQTGVTRRHHVTRDGDYSLGTSQPFYLLSAPGGAGLPNSLLTRVFATVTLSTDSVTPMMFTVTLLDNNHQEIWGRTAEVRTSPVTVTTTTFAMTLPRSEIRLLLSWNPAPGYTLTVRDSGLYVIASG